MNEDDGHHVHQGKEMRNRLKGRAIHGLGGTLSHFLELNLQLVALRLLRIPIATLGLIVLLLELPDRLVIIRLVAMGFICF